jgi:hypothetical protein
MPKDWKFIVFISCIVVDFLLCVVSSVLYPIQ